MELRQFGEGPLREEKTWRRLDDVDDGTGLTERDTELGNRFGRKSYLWKKPAALLVPGKHTISGQTATSYTHVFALLEIVK